jgi:hypothetical protein
MFFLKITFAVNFVLYHSLTDFALAMSKKKKKKKTGNHEAIFNKIRSCASFTGERLKMAMQFKTPERLHKKQAQILFLL